MKGRNLACLLIAVMTIVSTFTATSDDPQPEKIDVTKKVWNGSAWVDEIDAKIGDTVRFNITITYYKTGDPHGVYAKDLRVVDTLPPGLDYANAADPEPTGISGKKIYWNITITLDGDIYLSHGESYYIEFNATVSGYGVQVNLAEVTAIEVCSQIPLEGSDTAKVNVPGPPPGKIICDKKVWDSQACEWKDEITANVGDKVRFNLSITYKGDKSLTDIKVKDILPPCLAYADNADPVESGISGNIIFWNLSVTLQNDESVYIEFDADVISPGVNVNIMNVTAKEECVTLYCEACATVNVPIPPGRLICEKWVWDSQACEWVDEISANVGDKVRFNLSITYKGDKSLTDIKVKDILPPCLAYADNADPVESGISGNVIFWNLSVTLQNDESVYIEFDADVISPGVNVNVMNVSAQEDCETLYCEDRATVIAEQVPGIMICEKWVWDGCKWVDEIIADVGDTVRFNITIRYEGQNSLSNIRVNDTLPPCLEYANNADPQESGISGKKIFWNFTDPEDSLAPGESLSIYFDALVVSTMINVNLVNVTAYECSGVTLYCEDTATVIVPTNMTCEKRVWDGCEWVDEITADIGDIVRFNLTVTYTGTDYTLYNIRVKDTLPPCLEYANNANPPETAISGNRVFWNITDPDDALQPGESLHIYFDARVVSPGININVMNVTANECSGKVFECSDTATVNVPGPELECNKWVWDKRAGKWVDEISATVGEKVRFNITVKYMGTKSTYHVRILDILPAGLEYANNADPPETSVTDNKVLWDLMIQLKPGESVSVEFDATVKAEGTLVNFAEAKANECGDGKVVECSDTATVKAEKPAEPLRADAGGPYEGYINEPISFRGSATGGVPPYEYAWDLDYDGAYDDATGRTASWSWSTAGTYTIGLQVTDSIGNTDTDTARVSVKRRNNPPTKPEKPQGETQGWKGKEYSYTTRSEDPDGDKIYYIWDWGDGSTSEVGPYDSGVTARASHTWAEKGTYTIRVKARDEYGGVSEWSDPLEVSMPRSLFFLVIERILDHFPLLERFLLFLASFLI